MFIKITTTNNEKLVVSLADWYLKESTYGLYFGGNGVDRFLINRIKDEKYSISKSDYDRISTLLMME